MKTPPLVRRSLTASLLVVGALAVGAVTADAGTPRTPVWIGSPVASSTWPDASGCSGARYPSNTCSLPTVHHTYKWGNRYVGDFGIDLQNVSVGAPVRLYAAPQNNAYNGAVTARVESTGLACAAKAGETYSQTRARGGDYVRVGIYHGSTRTGTVTYVHVARTVNAGQRINRWGGQVGTVGRWTASPTNRCWTGVHLHVELYNDSNYACFNRSFRPGQRVQATNFLGYLGGSFASRGQQGCP